MQKKINKPGTSPVEEGIVDSKPHSNVKQESKLRERFQDLAANVEEGNLNEAITMLDSILKISPEELFNSEVRDEEVALERENELELRFYENSPYGGESKITSLECKSTVCKVEPSVPEGATFSPFPLLKWDSSMKSSRFHKKTKNNNTPSMTVYYGIAGSSLSDVIFDTKYSRKE